MQVTVTRNGPMAFLGTTGSGHSVQLDSAPDFGGTDTGARPMEMVLLGLGGCTAIDVLHILKKSRQNAIDCTVEIKAERATEDPKVFTKIHVHFEVSGENLSTAKVEKAVELSAEKYCSVSLMLSTKVDISHSFAITRV